MERWIGLKNSKDIEDHNNFKNIQNKLNNLFVVEYDSDYIASGDEDTKGANEAALKKVQRNKTT